MLTMKIEPIRGTTKMKAVSMVDEFDKIYDRWTISSALVVTPEKLEQHDLYKHRINACVRKYEASNRAIMESI